jgi:hypothetical protein
MPRMLGKLPRSFDQTIPHAASMRLMPASMGLALPSIPKSVNYFKGMPANLGMMLNGPDPSEPGALQLGDCTIAGPHHADQVWKWNASGLIAPTEQGPGVLADYVAFCGYVPGNPLTDQGGNEQNVLKDWMTVGMTNPDGTKDKIVGFVEIDPTNPDYIRRAIAECGVVYFGADIPEEWTEIGGSGSNWGLSNGPIAGGHCFIGCGFDPDQFLITSWGINAVNLDVAALKYVTECYAPISEDWVNATGMTPFNLPMNVIQQTMSTINMADRYRASAG